jgi:hypothetical protein
MAPPVVDGLEIVQVDVREREVPSVARQPENLGGEQPFLIVRTRVTSSVFSSTSPTLSAIFTRSPTRNARMYVRMTPETMLATAEVDPGENRTPRKIDTPRTAGDSEPGMYGKATTAANATTRTRTILNVGSPHSL